MNSFCKCPEKVFINKILYSGFSMDAHRNNGCKKEKSMLKYCIKKLKKIHFILFICCIYSFDEYSIFAAFAEC